MAAASVPPLKRGGELQFAAAPYDAILQGEEPGAVQRGVKLQLCVAPGSFPWRRWALLLGVRWSSLGAALHHCAFGPFASPQVHPCTAHPCICTPFQVIHQDDPQGPHWTEVHIVYTVPAKLHSHKATQLGAGSQL